MKCPKCNTNNPKKETHCQKCGTKLVKNPITPNVNKKTKNPITTKTSKQKTNINNQYQDRNNEDGHFNICSGVCICLFIPYFALSLAAGGNEDIMSACMVWIVISIIIIIITIIAIKI